MFHVFPHLPSSSIFSSMLPFILLSPLNLVFHILLFLAFSFFSTPHTHSLSHVKYSLHSSLSFHQNSISIKISCKQTLQTLLNKKFTHNFLTHPLILFFMPLVAEEYKSQVDSSHSYFHHSASFVCLSFSFNSFGTSSTNFPSCRTKITRSQFLESISLVLSLVRINTTSTIPSAINSLT